MCSPRHFSVLLASFQPHAVARRSDHFLKSSSFPVPRRYSSSLVALINVSWELGVSERTRIDHAGYRSLRGVVLRRRWLVAYRISALTRNTRCSRYIERQDWFLSIYLYLVCIQSLEPSIDHIRDNLRDVAALPLPLSENVVGNLLSLRSVKVAPWYYCGWLPLEKAIVVCSLTRVRP